MTRLERQIRELDEISLELYRACRFAHSLLDSKSRNADRIEERLRLAMGKAERWAYLMAEEEPKREGMKD